MHPVGTQRQVLMQGQSSTCFLDHPHLQARLSRQERLCFKSHKSTSSQALCSSGALQILSSGPLNGSLPPTKSTPFTKPQEPTHI